MPILSPELIRECEIIGRRRGKKLWFDVDEGGNRVAATTRQPGIHRGRDAERIVGGGGRCRILEDQEVFVPPAEIAEVDRHSPHHFALDACRELPIVWAFTPPRQHV